MGGLGTTLRSRGTGSSRVSPFRFQARVVPRLQAIRGNDGDDLRIGVNGPQFGDRIDPDAIAELRARMISEDLRQNERVSRSALRVSLAAGLAVDCDFAISFRR